MAGNEDDDTIFNDWYRNFLEKRKDNLCGQFVATADVRTEATKKLEELMEAMKDYDAQLAKCAEVARRKSKGKEVKLGSKGKEVKPESKGEEPKLGSNYDTPIKVESDSDEEPVRMRKYVGFQGEPSKFRGQCSGGKLAFGAGAEGGEADMDISEDEGIVKHVIDSTVAAYAEAEQEEPAVGVEGAGGVQQGQQQPQVNQEVEQEDEEEEAEEQYDSSEADNGYPYHYHSSKMTENDDEAYGFDSD